MSTSQKTKEQLVEEVLGKEGRERFVPFIEESMDLTMDKKLIINIATTGAFLTRDQNPNQALNPNEIAEAVIESYNAGAAIWHVHNRDDKGYASITPENAIKTSDMVFKECPDVITSISAWGGIGKQGVGLISPMIDPLVEAGSKYAQTAVIPAVPMVIGPIINNINEGTLTEMVTYLKDKGVKPEFQAFNFAGTENVRKWLIEPGVIKPPYFINAIHGTHAGVFYEAPTTPYTWGIIYLMHMLENLPPGTIKGATIGGRNWLPMVVVALILGVECVRIGMEDAVFMYPHKDERILICEDVVKKVVTIAKELGREIATPAEARKMLGLS